MGATVTTLAGTLSGKPGVAEGEVLAVGEPRQFRVPVSFTMSNSYSTGGDTLSIPGGTDIRGKDLLLVHICTSSDGTRLYDWDGNRTTPKIKAYSAIGTEVAAATNLSAVTIRAELVYAS